MRIAFVTETWTPSVNGVVTRLAMTIECLLADGHEVLVVAPEIRGAAEVPLPDGLSVMRVPSFSIPFIYGGEPWGFPLPRVTRAIAAFEPEIVHLVTPAMLGLAGLRAARRLDLPLVASFHTDLAAYARFYRLGFLSGFVWWWMRRIHRRASITLVTSAHAAALVTAHGFRHVVAWRRGVDVERFDPRRRHRETRAGDRPVALSVGRLAWEKGLHRLHDLAASGLVDLVVVGDGPDRDRLAAVFEGTPTTFLGTLTGEDLWRAYADADLFVFSSTTETLGLVLLEALASGLPIVAAESPASVELLGGREVARLFPAEEPAAAVEAARLLLESGRETDLASAARGLALDWDWPTATRGLVDSYRRVLLERRP
ncbi:glycosyltransferase family 4 protein [Frondihabitans australicus]|uniref:glycosyltransferase family 4 protein n=1 Tax=Frondihabitans australicus TaxID=386892 RepID=UPI0011C3C389|nr:glycosyltransferase family 1 protein [Frondihabitans australicus]